MEQTFNLSSFSPIDLFEFLTSEDKDTGIYGMSPPAISLPDELPVYTTSKVGEEFTPQECFPKSTTVHKRVSNHAKRKFKVILKDRDSAITEKQAKLQKVRNKESCNNDVLFGFDREDESFYNPVPEASCKERDSRKECSASPDNLSQNGTVDPEKIALNILSAVFTEIKRQYDELHSSEDCQFIV